LSILLRENVDSQFAALVEASNYTVHILRFIQSTVQFRRMLQINLVFLLQLTIS